MSAACGMSPERDQLAEAEIRSALMRYDRRRTRKRVGVYDDLQTRVARLEAIAVEHAALIQALIDRGSK